MTSKKYRSYLVMALLLVTLVGLLVRGIGLRERMYWTDECFSLLNMSGTTLSGMDDELIASGICSPSEVLNFQKPHGGVVQTVQSILLSEPEQMPLYGALVKIASSMTGGDESIARLVSCFAGTVLILLSFWLARELGTNRSTALACAALVSLSPLHVNLAQEARLYSLWTALIFLCSACLVRASRLNRFGWWMCYSLSLALCLYTIVLALVTIVAHWLYVLLATSTDRFKNVSRLALATVFSVGLFLPWTFCVAPHWELFKRRIEESSAGRGLSEHVRVWLEAASYLAGDVMDHEGLPRDYYYDLAQRAIAIFATVLFAYGLYRLTRFGPSRAKWFFISACLAVMAMQILPDLLLGGGRSAVIRYLIPVLGFGNLVIAIGLWAPPYFTASERKIRRGLLVAVCLLSVISLGVQCNKQVTWNRRGSAATPYMADAINQSTRPLVLYPRQGVVILPVAHLLDDHVRILAFEQPPNTIPPDFDNYFYLSEAGPPPKTDGFAGFRWRPAIDFHGLQVTLWRSRVPSDNAVLIKDRSSGAK